MTPRVFLLLLSVFTALVLPACNFPPPPGGPLFGRGGMGGPVTGPAYPSSIASPASASSTINGVQLEVHMTKIRASHRALLQMAGELRGADQLGLSPATRQAADCYEATRQRWLKAGDAVYHDIVTGQPAFTPLTNNALAAAEQSQRQFGDLYSGIKRQRSLLAGAVVLIQLADRLMGEAHSIADAVQRQQLACAVYQHFQLPDWNGIAPIGPAPSPAAGLGSPGAPIGYPR